jgi:hypothetical protein
VVKLADQFGTGYPEGGSHTTFEKGAVPAERLQQQGPIGTKTPAAPAVQTKPGERQLLSPG